MPMRRTLPLLVAALALAACARLPEPRNLLLVTIDSLRADHVGCYGYERATTPNLDRLASEGLRFTAASSPRARTTPALASVLTGLYPHDHGVRDLATPLPRHVPLLQEALRRGGFRTGAVLGNWALGAQRSGLERGFDLWVESFPDVRGAPPHDAPQRTARSLTDGALVALGLLPVPDEPGFEPRAPLAVEGRPWFLWLHYVDPHATYEPPAEHRLPEVPAGTPLLQLAPDGFTANAPPDAVQGDGRVDPGQAIALYDGEVRYVDHELGRLLEHLRASGLLERTVVVVAADHGESLGDHGRWFEHGLDPYEDTCRVPLVVRLPAGLDGPAPAPGVRNGALSLVDLAPTLLDLLGLPAQERIPGAVRDAPRGVTRLTLLRADDERPRPIFCETTERAEATGSEQSKAVRLGSWKLVRRYAVRPRLERPRERELVEVAEELYELGSDPREQRDLAAAPPAAAPLEALRRELDRFAAADEDLVDLDLVLQRRREALERGDPEVLRVLEALGY